MESKISLFACLTCGEFGKGIFSENCIEYETHMCSIANINDEQKKRSFLQLRAIIDEEIAKLSGNI